MKYLKQFFDHVCRKSSLYFFVFVIIFTIDRHHRLEHHVNEFAPFTSDVREYYQLLPELFLNESGTADQSIRENKRTIGMAVMYAPAFFVGHTIAKYKGETLNGYSDSYRWAIRWGSIIYSILGLIFLRKALLFFFKESVVTITLACVFFGANLFYYTYGWGEMPHSYLFFFYALFAWLTLGWIVRGKQSNLLWIGLVAGMITLIRPTGIVVLLFPLLFGITSRADLRQRFVLILQQKRMLAISVLFFLVPLIFQMIFWKIHTGNFIRYSYGREGFFFTDPQVSNFLFSFRKGWLVYTPIMLFAIVGLFLSRKKLPQFFIFSILFLAVNVYVLSSWWEWSFGGSFGCRALVEAYVFLAFPFAVTIDWIWFNRLKIFPKSAIRIATLLVLLVLVRFNIWQIYLFRAGVIHWSGMNKETYTYIFVRDEFTEADYQYLNSKFSTPDPEGMMNGERDK